MPVIMMITLIMGALLLDYTGILGAYDNGDNSDNGVLLIDYTGIFSWV